MTFYSSVDRFPYRDAGSCWALRRGSHRRGVGADMRNHRAINADPLVLQRPNWCGSRVDIHSAPDTGYRRENRQMMYVGNKFPQWCPDFRRVAPCYALSANARRVGALDVVQFLHLAAGGRALRFDSGELHVCGRGSCMPFGRIPSEEIIRICREYAYDADGLALPLYRVATSPGNGETPYEASDRAYRARAGEESSLSFSDVSAFRIIRSADEDYAGG